MALRRRRQPRETQGEDHFLCAILLPAGFKDRLERALGTATDADLGGPHFASFYVPLEDFEDMDTAQHQGRALGRALHGAVTGEG